MTAPDEPADPLPRVLGPWLAGAIVVGTVIGTGVFKKGSAVSAAVPETGPALLAWVAVGLLTLCGAMALAEVAALFPRAGGNYVFLREAYGRPFGFLWGWVEFWFLRCASCAALAVVFAESLADVLRQARGSELAFWDRQAVAAGVVTALGLLAARGTRLGAGVQLVVSSVKLGSLVGIAVLPGVVLGLGTAAEVTPSVANLQPVWPERWNWSAFAVAMVAVLWPYNGWTNVAPIAGEVRDPQRNIPRAFVGGVLTLIVVYTGINLSYYLTLPAAEMARVTGSPVASEVCRRLAGPAGLLAASAAVMLSVFGALGGNMLVGPRGVFALSRGGLAPAVFGRVHSRYRTPLAATLLMTGVTVGFIYAVAAYTEWRPPARGAKAPFDVLTDFVVFGAGVFELLAVGTVYVFRRRYPGVTLPYRCPGYPVVPAVYLVAMTAVFVNMLASPADRAEAVAGVGFIAVGAGVYAAVYRRAG
jgi:amino acid transporter